MSLLYWKRSEYSILYKDMRKDMLEVIDKCLSNFDGKVQGGHMAWILGKKAVVYRIPIRAVISKFK